MTSSDISIRNHVHPGLVAALCDEPGIADMIDTLLPGKSPAKVSHGQAFVAMLPEYLAGLRQRGVHH